MLVLLYKTEKIIYCVIKQKYFEDTHFLCTLPELINRSIVVFPDFKLRLKIGFQGFFFSVCDYLNINNENTLSSIFHVSSKL